MKMTLQDITEQAMQLAVGGYINGEKFTAKRMRDTFSRMLDTANSEYIFEVSMPDGRWFCKAVRRDFGYDLIVPDSREQEQQIKDELFKDGRR
jgi:hypothetical protein